MPIPYMGSKRLLAHRIYQVIKNMNPSADTLVDLFCGGFAISEKFIRSGWKVIANDKNKYVAELIKAAISGKFNDAVFTPEFITREKFNDVMENTNKYDTWYVGYVQCIWSFGNNQKGYLFGRKTEPIKHAGHKLVIDRDPSGVVGLISQKYIDGILQQNNWHKRRIALFKVIQVSRKRLWELQQPQQLERLEQLQRLERLEQLEQPKIYCNDYKNIEIPKGSIVYCDPPYQSVAEYKEDGFDHNEFWDWVRKQSKLNKIYVSEYKAPDDFIKILEISKNSTLSGGYNKKQPNECLFIPRGQEKW